MGAEVNLEDRLSSAVSSANLNARVTSRGHLDFRAHFVLLLVFLWLLLIFGRCRSILLLDRSFCLFLVPIFLCWCSMWVTERKGCYHVEVTHVGAGGQRRREWRVNKYGVNGFFVMGFEWILVFERYLRYGTDRKGWLLFKRMLFQIRFLYQRMIPHIWWYFLD